MGHADFLEHGQMDQIIHKANNKTKERDNGLLLLYTQSLFHFISTQSLWSPS